MAQLSSLRSLHLLTTLHPDAHTPADLLPHASSIGRLSALTALTHLQLDLPRLYEDLGDSWSQRQKDGSPQDQAEWCAVREAHHTSLVSALCCMPQLQHLDCPTLWLRPSEAASLTALTSLTLGGLLPPAPPTSATGRGVATLGGSVWALPPRLEQLAAEVVASPRVLAHLQLPPSFRSLLVDCIRLGTRDVMPDDWRIEREAFDAMGPAVQRLVSHPGEDPQSWTVCIDSDGCAERLRPLTPGPAHHKEFLRRLQGLDVFGVLELCGLELSAGDLCILGQTLPNLRGEECAGAAVKGAAQHARVIRGPSCARYAVDTWHVYTAACFTAAWHQQDR